MQLVKPCGILSLFLLAISGTLYVTLKDLTVVGNVTAILMSGIAAVCIWRTANYIEFKDEKKFWELLFVSITFYFIGELTWAYNELVLGNKNPLSPSIADIFWILGAIMMIYAMYAKLQTVFMPVIAKRAILAFIVGGLGILVMLYPLINTIVQNGILISTFFDFLYPILDIIMVMMAVLIVIPMFTLPRRLAIPWIFIGLSFISFAIYDFSFALFRLWGVYYTGRIVDLIYFISYMLFTLAGYYKMSLIKKKGE